MIYDLILLFEFNFIFFKYYTLQQLSTLFFLFYTPLALPIKFLLCIFLLILIRGGTPRYRFDFLTKLGWIKILSLVISIYFITLFLLLIL